MDVPTPQKVFRTRVFRSIGWAAALAVTAVGLYIWGERHDNPPAEPMTVSGEISFRGHPLKVTLDCTCPKYLTENHDRNLPFGLKFTMPPTVDRNEKANSVTKQRIFVSIDAGNSKKEPAVIMITDDPESLFQNVLVTTPTPVKVQPMDASLSEITFAFFSDDGTPESPSTPLGSVVWTIGSENPAIYLLAPYGFALFVFCSAGGVFFWADNRLRNLREKTDQKLAQMKSQADADPKQARFAWDLARVKLEAYFDRNLIQVNLVFWVAVFVMTVGFGFVLTGVVLAYSQPKAEQSFSASTQSELQSSKSLDKQPGSTQTSPAQTSSPQVSQTTSEQSSGPHVTSASLVAAVSGIITQFIGATFMVIYRSTMAQASGFMTVLERINNVGMAVQVLDSLPDGTDLKNTTRAAMVIALLKNNSDLKADSSASPTTS